MKRFISYLYEYGQGRKIRNIGFAKVELKDSEGIMQIHGKGIQPPGQGKAKVYLCYERRGNCIGIFQGEIEHTEPSVDYRLLYTSEDTGGQETFDKIAGIVLKTDDGRTYAALWGEKPMDPEMMQDQAGLVKEFPLEEKESQQEETEKLTKETKDDSSLEIPEKEEADMQEQEASETADEIRKSEDDEPEENIEEPQKEEPTGKEMELHEMECEETCHEPVIQYEKITREDLAKLPRCEWGNANNTFLLHGYRNYHHLLLIEDGGQLWLGVPGVYHEREQMAASSCGFPRFWRIPSEQLTLSKEERNDGEDFGYWCRKVRKRR